MPEPLHDGIAACRHGGGRNLHDQVLIVAIDDQPGQPVPLAVDLAVTVGSLLVEPIGGAGSERGFEPRGQPIGGWRILGETQHSHRDRRNGGNEPPSEDFSLSIENPGKAMRIRTPLDACDLLAADPRTGVRSQTPGVASKFDPRLHLAEANRYALPAP